MGYIFLIEDSLQMADALIEAIEKRTGHGVVWASSKKEAETILKDYNLEYFAAVVDLTLPDADGFEALDLALVYDMPTVVFTSNLHEGLRQAIWGKGIVDYVLKDSNRSMDYVLGVLERLQKNDRIKILIVDDSLVMRQEFKDRLEAHRFQVLAVASGEQALKALDEHPDIKLMLVDYLMPGMDGVELTSRTREHHGKEELAIIALSGQDNEEVSIQFIKAGANDYIDKRMSLEGFYSRINHHVEMIENLELLREAGYRDYLTGLYNRRYFFETARSMFARARRKDDNLSLAMIDIDHFKNINDTHGHDAGDEVIKQIAHVLQDRFRSSDIVARFGGEEFCILLSDSLPEETPAIFETLRREIEELEIETDEGVLHVTVSIGVCTRLLDSVEEMVSLSDKLLYEAKNAGRNRVESDLQSF